MLKINGVSNKEEIAMIALNATLLYLVITESNIYVVSLLGLISCGFVWFKRAKHLHYKIRILGDTWSKQTKEQELRWGVFVAPVLFSVGETFLRLTNQDSLALTDAFPIIFLVFSGAWTVSEFFQRVRI